MQASRCCVMREEKWYQNDVTSTMARRGSSDSTVCRTARVLLLLLSLLST